MSDEELFLTAILHCSRSDLYTRDVRLNDPQKEQLQDMRRRRAAGEPVQYICGFTEFLGYRIEVGPGVLVPRPETEVLADAVIRELKNLKKTGWRVLDIGTGSGCLPIALTKEIPGLKAVGLDVSAEALIFARRNAARNSVEDRIEFIEQDMFRYTDACPDGLDAIVSNPPYIPTAWMDLLPADVKNEPVLALDGGPDGLHFYRYIVPTAARVLKPGGLLALEFGDGQARELQNLFAITGGWDKIRAIADNAGKDRVIMAHKCSP